MLQLTWIVLPIRNETNLPPRSSNKTLNQNQFMNKFPCLPKRFNEKMFRSYDSYVRDPHPKKMRSIIFCIAKDMILSHVQP